MFWNWVWLLAYVTGNIDQELLLRNEYLLAENKVIRSKLPKRIAFTDNERRTLGEIAHRLGKQALAGLAQAVTPRTLLGWDRQLVAEKYDGPKARKARGRPRMDIDGTADGANGPREPKLGRRQIVVSLSNLGHRVSAQAVGPRP